jgi:hypothetical protein
MECMLHGEFKLFSTRRSTIENCLDCGAIYAAVLKLAEKRTT